MDRDTANTVDPIEALEAELGGSNVAPARSDDASDAGDAGDQGAGGQPAKGKAAAPAAPATPARTSTGDVDADELLRELGAAADEALSEEEIFDNLKLLDFRAQREAERRAAAQDQAQGQQSGEDEGGEGGEDDDEGEENAGAEAEEERGDGEEEDDDGTTWGEFLDKLGLDADGAQALLDHLLNESKYAPQLRLRYRANGQDVEEPWSEVRQKAAGYMGQPEVTRRLQEADSKIREAEAREARVNAALENIQALLAHLDDPDAFVEKTIAPNSSLEYMVALRDALNKKISEAEEDPGSYKLNQRLSNIERLLARVFGGEAAPTRADDGAATAAEPPANGKRSAAGPVPEDFGFVPGVGYGDYAEAAYAALQQAARIGGIEVSAVLQRWRNEGRQRPVFDVLDEMVKLRQSDKSKKDLARRPPVSLPSSARAGRGPAKPNPTARRPPRWEDIEKLVARDLQRLMGAGS